MTFCVQELLGLLRGYRVGSFERVYGDELFQDAATLIVCFLTLLIVFAVANGQRRAGSIAGGGGATAKLVEADFGARVLGADWLGNSIIAIAAALVTWGLANRGLLLLQRTVLTMSGLTDEGTASIVRGAVTSLASAALASYFVAAAASRRPLLQIGGLGLILGLLQLNLKETAAFTSFPFPSSGLTFSSSHSLTP